MRKPLLLIAALTIAITSCQKPATNNNPYVCTCNYAFQRGFYYVADTMVNTTYASGTSFTQSQLYCTNAQTAIVADSGTQNVKCYIHQ